MKGWKKKQQQEVQGVGKSLRAQMPGVILGVLCTLLTGIVLPLLTDRFAILDSRIVHAGPPPLTVKFTEVKPLPGGFFEYHVKHGIRLKNNGWRNGHVERVELARNGLKEYPEKVTVLHVDKTDLGWLEEKVIEYDFVVLMKTFPEKEKEVSFRTTYYGSSGNEIYTEFSVIELERVTP